MSTDNELLGRKKQKRFEEWMLGDHVLVQLDARHSGVEVPTHLSDNPALTLKLSYRFQGETSTDDTGITTYLRFSGDYFKCVIPWEAVWGMAADTGESEVWTEDVPKEVVLQVACAKLSEFGRKIFKRSDDSESDQPQSAEPLRAVPDRSDTPIGDPPSTDEDPPEPDDGDGGKERRRPQLKRIK